MREAGEMVEIKLTSPLDADWTAQYVKLHLAGVRAWQPGTLTLDGETQDFQYTGAETAAGAQILVKLGLAQGETKTLRFEAGAGSRFQVPGKQEMPLAQGVRIGVAGRELVVGEKAPFLGFAGRAMASEIRCEAAFEGASLSLVHEGPLFVDYALEYRYADERRYRLDLRCYKLDPYIEVCETFSLRMHAELVWTLNPDKQFTHIISRDSFEGENQPTVEPLGVEHPRDVLCRLQMPVLTEYFIPNNRGWFAFCDARNEADGMVGILGLYGAKWEEPVANMPEVFDRDGTVEWHASLASGKRHWLLYAGPVEKGFRVQGAGFRGGNQTDRTDRTGRTDLDPDPRFVFHRLHAEFNALRLDEHLDLGGDAVFDASCAQHPGVFAAGDFHAAAQQRLAAYACLREVLPTPDDWLKANGGMHMDSFRYLLDPTPETAQMLYTRLIERFARWVRQFQGYRTGDNDYMKNVIGFSRYLRGMLLAYEQLRRDGRLDDDQIGRLNAYFGFAARRILDEGRWPHSRTWKHPDHPESSRDFYTYGGEHKPDRLVWTNSLPNFQSDPMCALAHLSAIFKDHPDAAGWLRFALDDIERQLDAYCGKSGAWQESINYALYTLSYFVITFKVVKARWGIDYFHDARVRRYVDWLCRFAGPRDKRFGVYTMPGIGNAVLPQLGQDFLLCYATELEEGDPLRAACMEIWRRGEEYAKPSEHYPVVMAAMAPIPAGTAGSRGMESGMEPAVPAGYHTPLRPLTSELMDEVGVALRDRYDQTDESYLFQKIGFAKDHYEADESAFNWYAKGTPLCMDYGTYTSDVGTAGAHNLVEIPDADPLRRGYLAGHLFTPAVDYTHCELPVMLKLLWGKVRTFAEVENKDGKIDRNDTPYYYIGDNTPVGPKTWKVRKMLFVKPDYVVLFDRVYGQVPHRYNLHVTGTGIQVSGAGCRVSGDAGTMQQVVGGGDGTQITAEGRFDLDLLAHVQHPAAYELETGELVPNVHRACGAEEVRAKHAQHYFRIYNKADGMYRTLLFARERARDVQITSVGSSGMKVVTPEYTDYVFVHDEVVEERTDAVAFTGRCGWIRKHADGRVQAVVPDGERIEAFGLAFTGRGPWSFDANGQDGVSLHGGPPRQVSVLKTEDGRQKTEDCQHDGN